MININYENYGLNLESPSICPHCHHGIEPVYVSNNIVQKQVYTVWKCTFKQCGKQFIAVYQITDTGQQNRFPEVRFTGFLDGTPVSPHWPETIKNLTSNFIKTYTQALQAEHKGLDEIAGMGYRKSIEYLVKDYLIHRDPALIGKIEDHLLMQVIGDHFGSPQEADLKSLLQRATWLGNDETHYLRYHENFDIEDLKELIKLVMDELHSIEQKRHYMEKLQGKPKKGQVVTASTAQVNSSQN